MFFRVSIVIVALAWPRSTLSADTAQCYNPDGSKAVGDIPCFRSDSLSRVCCSSNQVCSSNGLCVSKDASAPQQTFRGSCLDPAFGPSCPTFCKGVTKNAQAAVVSCGDPKAGKWCCDEGKGAECCNTPSKILALGVGSMSPGPSSMGSMGTMLNAPAAQSPPPSISLQTTTIVSYSTVTSLQISTSIISQSLATSVSMTTPAGPPTQPAVAQPISAPTLPPVPFTPVQSGKKEEELLRGTASSAPSFSPRPGVEAALIAEAAVRQPAQATSPPLSGVTIASVAIGSVIVVTLIIVISVIMLRWRIAAKKAEEYQGQEDASGANPQDREKGTNMPGGAGPPEWERNVAQTGGPMGLAAMNRSRSPVQAMRPEPARMPANPFRSPLPSPRWQSEERYQARASEFSGLDYNRNSDPFYGGTPLPQPGRNLVNGQWANEAVDSPTKGYYNNHRSEWSVATLTTAHPVDTPRVDRTRGVSALDREVDALRSRYPEQYRDRNTTFSDDSNMRNPPTVETSTGMRIPAAALERRVSGPGPENMNSKTFQKLLYDVQSRPF